MHHFFDFRQTADAVTYDIDLPITAHLEVHGFSNNLATWCVQFGLYGIAVGGRRLYDAKVACSHQAKLQGTRNRSCGEGKRVDVCLHLSQLFLCRNAKLLLLVYDQQAQVVKLHRLADEFVCADDDVHLALLQVAQDFVRLLC